MTTTTPEATVQSLGRHIANEMRSDEVRWDEWYEKSTRPSGVTAYVNKGPRNFICHPHVYLQTEWAIQTEWAMPVLIPSCCRTSMHFGWYPIPWRSEAQLNRTAGYIPRWFAHPKTVVTHPNTNRTWCNSISVPNAIITITNQHQTTLQEHTHNTTVLLLFWNMSGTTRVSRYQKGKTRKVKTNLDLLEQETVSGSGISWAICKSAPHPRQPRQHPTTQFLQAGCPSCRPTNSVKALKDWHCKN